jgi:hypothetical protein
MQKGMKGHAEGHAKAIRHAKARKACKGMHRSWQMVFFFA